jgi:hypothetical protein
MKRKRKEKREKKMGKIAFKAKKGGDFKLPPEGTYDWIVKDFKDQDPDDDGNPRFFLQLEVAEGEHSGSEVRAYFTLSEERAWTLRPVLESSGIDFDHEEGGEGEPDGYEFDSDDLIGRYVRASMTHYHNERTKKTYPNFVEWQVSPLQEAAEQPTDAPPESVPQKNAAPSTVRRRPQA